MSFNSVSKELQNIISDNASGSRDLLDKLVTYFKEHRDEIDLGMITTLQQHFSDFQTIKNFLSNLEIAINDGSVEKFLSEYNQQDIFESIYNNFKSEIINYNSFLTISNSKTIFEVFKLIAKEKESIKVFVSEGRPVCEGKLLAENLAVIDISTALITESQIYETIQNCDCAVIGADKILTNGNVINKVGSNLLALACKKFDKPLFVLADKSKIGNDDSFIRKKMPRDEIYSGDKIEIEINNYYFEEIPKEYITKIITD